ncbi:MAG TPA: sigma-54-dependent Fis family transcriptional regulator [Ignavibacteriaceae bacterium]|nr:sigma-54-dependent Fis family transcriptional regulator [Ignavibacteriaceae bacterium]
MSDLKDNTHNIHPGSDFNKISSTFMELNTAVNSSPEILEKVEKLFKLIMESNQKNNSEINKLIEKQKKDEDIISNLKEDKRRLEVLYSSGILFSSETETKALIGIAIDTVVRELNADSGFILLTNQQGEVEAVYPKNMKPEENPDAMEMSMTVVKNTIQASSPVQVNDASSDSDLSKRESILKLGITAVLCVPLVSDSKVLGAVYIDRRKKENHFSQNDLFFLLSFARQIVRAIEVSSEISNLEKRLLTDALVKFEDLRKEFKCEEFIGSGRKLFEVLKIAAKISPTDTSVVILGENGTGKDVLAKTIHQNSRREGKPFINIDCSSIPADLLESELFGFESGAFTGATKSKPGKLEIADEGTLFFNEIGEMSINLQAKLLRVIQTGEIERLGSVQTKKINVRIICATNRNLTEMISKGEFREDLYYRLKVIELKLPPLRERKEDISELCNYFIKKHGQGKDFTLSNEALEVLEEYSWPGNIRELENVILRCVVLSKDNVIEVSDLPPEIVEKSSDELSIKPGRKLLEAETEFRKMYILRTLRQTSSKAEAAQLLGINRTHFYKLLSQLEIDL